MRTILEELFYGNICPNTDCRSHNKETKQLMGYIADHHDNLLSTLNEQQKEILEKFDDCYNELTDINEREIFSYAFKLGARLVLAAMIDESQKSSSNLLCNYDVKKYYYGDVSDHVAFFFKNSMFVVPKGDFTFLTEIYDCNLVRNML